jgi:hypothetical protein
LPSCSNLHHQPLVRWLAWLIAHVLFLVGLVFPTWYLTVGLTPLSVDAITISQSFNGDKARRVLGYSPLFSAAEAEARTLAYLANRRDL